MIDVNTKDINTRSADFFHSLHTINVKMLHRKFTFIYKNYMLSGYKMICLNYFYVSFHYIRIFNSTGKKNTFTHSTLHSHAAFSLKVSIDK